MRQSFAVRQKLRWIGLVFGLFVFALLVQADRWKVVPNAFAGSPPSTANRQETQQGNPADPAAGAASTRQDPSDAAQEKAAADDIPPHPFELKQVAPDFPADMTWINTAGPLRKQDLKGKFVVLDFWTYCCINCIHILPELKKLERKYPNEIVVIGVHSAKFETEQATKNIEEAVLRYEIEHPVVNDSEHRIWRQFRVRSWPSLRIIDPEGFLVTVHSGEIRFEVLDNYFQQLLPIYRKRGTLDETPIRFEGLAERVEPTPLRFPGKVLAHESSQRLFIADSNHNRIVITDLDGNLRRTIGSGEIGRRDGGFAEASFHHPQGMALVEDNLYIADTENHLIRRANLRTGQVDTIAGTGVQADSPWPGWNLREPDALPDRWVGPPKTTALNSPWSLLYHQNSLYIAMAGPHQIWRWDPAANEIGPYAGNGREDIVDGKLLPREPYDVGSAEAQFSAFAQPSGLATDGHWLYVADSEGSSIRAVPFEPSQLVRTVVGTNKLPGGRLFEFGDRDGKREEVLMQHPLGVAYHEGKIYVADTYNNKIRVVDAASGDTQTFAGNGTPGNQDEPAQFDEPTGVSVTGKALYVADTNNHLIRRIDLVTRKVSTLAIEGLEPPPRKAVPREPDLSDAVVRRLEPQVVQLDDGKVQVVVELKFPPGWKLNPLSQLSYRLRTSRPGDATGQEEGGWRTLDQPSPRFTLAVPLADNGTTTLSLAVPFLYCATGGEGLCRMTAVVFEVPLSVGSEGQKSLKLTYDVEVPKF